MGKIAPPGIQAGRGSSFGGAPRIIHSWLFAALRVWDILRLRAASQDCPICGSGRAWSNYCGACLYDLFLYTVRGYITLCLSAFQIGIVFMGRGAISLTIYRSVE